MVTTVWHSPSVYAYVSPTACWRGPSENLGPLYADWLEKVSTKFRCHEIQFHGKCFWHHKPVPSSEQAKKKNIHSRALEVVSSHFSFRELIPSPLSFSTHQICVSSSGPGMLFMPLLGSSKCLPVATFLYGHLGLEYLPWKSHLPQNQKSMFRQAVKYFLGVYMPQLSQKASHDQNEIFLLSLKTEQGHQAAMLLLRYFHWIQQAQHRAFSKPRVHIEYTENIKRINPPSLHSHYNVLHSSW